MTTNEPSPAGHADRVAEDLVAVEADEERLRHDTERLAEDLKAEKPITYFVNGEPQHTTDHKLTVAKILEDAGFAPATEWQLERDEGHHKYTDYDELVPLREGEKFTATFIGPTPTS